jgi:hypothetical protein
LGLRALAHCAGEKTITNNKNNNKYSGKGKGEGKKQKQKNTAHRAVAHVLFG